MTFTPGWEKPVIILILILFMCVALFKGIALPEIFWTIIMFQLGMNTAGAVADRHMSKIQDENKELRQQNAMLVATSMRAGDPVIVPAEKK